MTLQRSIFDERKKLRKNRIKTTPNVDREINESIERAKPNAIPVKKHKLNRIIVR
jgi:hypothetical protein